MRWAGDVVRKGETRNSYKILSENLKGRDNLRNLSKGRRIILKLIVKKQLVRLWHGFVWVRILSSGEQLWTR